MRILQIRFSNLNSLVGEWLIDLTHPDYLANGLFAITGPTGAGKSTLLDAICLALYGETPRLGKISGTDNELMARQTGSCFAEVTFASQSGQYRAHWSQHRARQRPDGQLQPPRHELAEAASGTLLASKKSEVPRQVEAVTGLDYSRFVRAMLLAQGQFAAFLQASDDERAPILEQITGTEIYSRISMQVHQRLGEEKQALAGLEAGLQGLKPLPDEAVQQLERELAAQQARAAALLPQQQAARQALDWLQERARLETQQQHLQEEQAGLTARQQAFLPEQARLEAAVRAMALEVDWRLLERERQQQAGLQARLETLEQAGPPLQQALAQAEAARQQAWQHQQQARETLQQRLPLLQQARVLDVQRQEHQQQRDGQQAALLQDQQARAVLQQALQQLQLQQRQQQQALAELDARLAVREADGLLVSQLAAIEQQFDQWQQLQDRARQLQDDQQQACSRRDQALQDSQSGQAARQQLQQQLDDCLAWCQQQGARLQALLAEDRLDDLQQQVRQAGQQLAQLQQALEYQQRAAALAGEQARCQQAWQQRRARQAELQAEQVSRQQQRDTLQRQQALLEERQRLLQRIASLESQRQQLQAGEPCPLCGALEHPWAGGQRPQEEPGALELDPVRQQLAGETEAITGLQLALARLETQLQQDQLQLQQLAQAIAETDEALARGLALIPEHDRPTDIEVACQQAGQSLQQLEQRLEAALALKAGLDQAQHQQAGHQQALLALEPSLHQAGQALSQASECLQQLERQQQLLQTQLQHSEQALQAALQPLGMVLTGEATALLAGLRQRCTAWQQDQQQQRAGQQALARLQVHLEHQQQRLQQAGQALEARQQALAGQDQVLAGLHRQRQQLLGELDPDREEQRLQQAMDQAGQQLEQARQLQEQAARALQQQVQQRQHLQDEQTGLQAALARLQQVFAGQLAQAGFAGEAAWQQARLAEDARQTLAGQARALQAEERLLASHQADNARALALVRQQALTDQPLAAVQARLETLQQDQQALQQAIGALQQQLAEQAGRRQRLQQQLQTVALQRAEVLRWQQLHAVIGSSDGKKFRNFAQGLTFEVMVGQANRQLEKMTDRYLLLRDAAQPLELKVLDNYQAGEIRSTRNLSGGESFLVSLALALGLSGMASRTIRVDSLFLDEGFGTLDEAALDMALDTLSGLQQEGKLIGVISHVPALKERIATRIRVMPLGGGRSQLQGPGCSRQPGNKKPAL